MPLKRLVVSPPPAFQRQLYPKEKKGIAISAFGKAGLLGQALNEFAKFIKSALEGQKPDLIATTNIGCQLHLQTGTKTLIVHWIELIDQALEI